MIQWSAWIIQYNLLKLQDYQLIILHINITQVYFLVVLYYIHIAFTVKHKA